MSESKKVHEMRVLTGRGDDKYTWDVDVEEQVAVAQQQFEALVKQGYLAYAFEQAGGQGKITRKFKPEVERYVLTPALAGG